LFDGIEAVLFDLDETLIDAETGLMKAHERVAHLILEFLKVSGVQVDTADLLLKIKLLDDHMNRDSQYDRNLWWPTLVAEFDPSLELPEDLASRMTAEYWESYSKYSLPYPDTISVLECLRQCGYKLGLVSDTDGSPGVKLRRINMLSFREFLSVVVVAGEDTVELKPSSVPFLKASRLLGVSNEATVFVGDKPFTDIAGAKEAGMRTIHVWRRRWNSDVRADLTVRSLTDLLPVLLHASAQLR
jgi:putative hydrolase of the HAD superfamily